MAGCSGSKGSMGRRGQAGKVMILAYSIEWELGAGHNRTQRLVCGHSRPSESLWLPISSGPLPCEDPPPLPSPANHPVSGSRRRPPSSAAANFLLAGLDLLLCCPSSLPPVHCWRGLHGAMPLGERRESWVHSEKGSPCQCPNPLSWWTISSLRGSPKATHLLRKSVENGSLLGSKFSCQSIHLLVGLGLPCIPHPREEA